MKYLFICLFIYLFVGCSELKNTNKHSKQEKTISETTIVTPDSLNIIKSKADSKTVDTLQIGSTFFKYDAFVGYKYITSEPYEFIELNNEKNSTQIMIYLNSNKYYAILVSAEDNVEKYDSDWEKISKTVVDIVSYQSKYELCWYLYDGNTPPAGRFGIGIKTNETSKLNEYSNCQLYKKYKVFDVDYKKGKIKEVNTNDFTFCCSDGY
ncbi:hypothetical protein ACFSTE_04635 [Aquimarina hainanensis]|uniref:Lipoprotein n=1 Tax=Aquimarina hainanensis TaxID=1578017 RepID=A0ABW5N3A6_9FLAO